MQDRINIKSMTSIPLKLVRNLTSISAGSGLLMDKRDFYVIADDELFLWMFPRDGASADRSLQLIPGALPADHIERKRLKPDFEAMATVANGILILPSGSKPNRQRGCWVVDEKVMEVSCQELYQILENKIPSLNIEGCTVCRNKLMLFHRGNGAGSQNAIVYLDLGLVTHGLQMAQPFLPKDSLKEVQMFDLGQIEGYPLGFTDAATDMDGRVWYIAVAEATDSTYDDGEYIGAVLGYLDPVSLRPVRSFPLEIAAKPEGLCLTPDLAKFYVVTDADDRSKPALLFEGFLPEMALGKKKPG